MPAALISLEPEGVAPRLGGARAGFCGMARPIAVMPWNRASA